MKFFFSSSLCSDFGFPLFSLFGMHMKADGLSFSGSKSR